MSDPVKLTRREKEVVELLGSGHKIYSRRFSRLFQVFAPGDIFLRKPVTTVSRATVASLMSKKQLKVGCPLGEFTTRYVLFNVPCINEPESVK